MNRTVIIESNRQASRAMEYEADKDARLNTPAFPALTNHSWQTFIEYGVKLNQGDSLSIESSQINISGQPNDTIEFLGGLTNLGVNPLVDNICAVKYAYYITNLQQFNAPMPMDGMHIKDRLVDDLNSVDYGGPDLTAHDWDGQYYGAFSSDPGPTRNYTDAMISAAALPYIVPDPAIFTDSNLDYTIFANKTNGPHIIRLPNQTKMFITNVEQDWYAAEGLKINDLTLSNVLFTDVLKLEAKTGFVTPSALGNDLTSQLNMRSGDADNWTIETFSPGAEFINEKFAEFTDATYKTFTTAQSENNQNPNAGFWNQMLCSDTKQMIGALSWNVMKQECLSLGHKLAIQPSIIQSKIYIDAGMEFTSSINNEKFNYYGQQIIVADHLDEELNNQPGDKLIYGLRSDSKYNVPSNIPFGNNQSTAAEVLKLDDGSLVPTNIVLTDASIDALIHTFQQTQFVVDDAIIRDNNVNYDNIAKSCAVNMQFGRLDDKNSLALNNYVHLACPNMCNWWFAQDNIPQIAQTYRNIAYAGGNEGKPASRLPPGTTVPVYPNLVPNAAVVGSQTLATVFRMLSLSPNTSGPQFPSGNYKTQFYSSWEDRFDPSLPDPFVKLASTSQYQFTTPGGSYFDVNKLKPLNRALMKHGLACVGVFLKPAAERDAAYQTPAFLPATDAICEVPFCAFISKGGVGKEGILVPRPVWGEFFGYSMSLLDGQYAKMFTTQPNIVSVNLDSYYPVVHAGAINPAIAFDSDVGRFKITDLHTPLFTGNGIFQDPRNETAPDLTVASVFAKCAAIDQSKVYIPTPTAPTWTKYILEGTEPDKVAYDNPIPTLDYSDIVQGAKHRPTISSQSGIGWLDYYVPTLSKDSNDTIPEVSKVDDINSYWSKLDAFAPLTFGGTLFDKLGFEIEQLKPMFAKEQNQFNRSNVNLYLGTNQNIKNKQSNMVYPLTTNAYIAGNLSLALTSAVYNSDTTPVTVLMENLGGPAYVEVKTQVESDALIANNLPSKLSYSYLVVHSDILQQTSSFYGSQRVTNIPAIGYITRNYESADFFFSFATDWAYIIDKPQMLNSFVVDIRLPNGRPAPLDPNSSILFKITKNKEVVMQSKPKSST